MRWIDLTSAELERYGRKKDAVAVVSVGSLEKHGEQLPVGCDAFSVDRLISRVEKKEEIVVLPVIKFAMVPCMKAAGGAVSAEPDIFLRFLENLCDEIYRNGFKKIVLVNWHGGNRFNLKVFVREVLNKEKPYILYALVDPWNTMIDVKEMKKYIESKYIGHACEMETSFALALFPEFCKLDRIPKATVGPKNRYDVYPAFASVEFFGEYPGYYVGNARKASAVKGEIFMKEYEKNFVDFIRKVKRDRETEKVMKEFYKKSRFGGNRHGK